MYFTMRFYYFHFNS